MITDVGIDLDGVLFDFSAVVTKHFSEYFGQEFPTPQGWEFYEEWGLSASAFYELLDKLTYEREIFNDAAPISKSMVGWQNLKEQGLKLHVITHRSPSAYGQTVRWLERYRMIPDSLHFSGQKADILNAISTDESAAIDDYIEQYRDYENAGVRSYMFRQQWNRGYPVRHVDTLPEFADAIKLYNQYWKMENKHTIETMVF